MQDPSANLLIDARQDDSDARRLSTPDRLFALSAAMLSILCLWLPYLRSSFWLDETGTAWIIGGSFTQTISRSAAQGLVGQSPLFYVIAWTFRKLLGSSEAAIRLPSLLAMAATVWVLYRIGVRLLDRTSAAFGAATFTALIWIAFAAVDARPYALALLAFSLSTLALLRWEENRDLGNAVAYVVFATLTVYITYMFAIGLIAHGIFAYRRAREGGLPLKRFAMSWIWIAILIAPSLPRLYRVVTAPDILKWVGSHNDEFLGDAQLLLPILIACLTAVLLIRARGTRRLKIPRSPSGTLLLGALALVPPLTFLVLSYIVAPKFFVHRYFLEFTVGLALAAGLFFASLPRRERYIGVGVLLLIPLLGFRGDVHRQDWRGAARAITARSASDTPILLSGFSSQPTNDPERQGFLRAPLSVYNVRGNIILLPSDLGTQNIPLLQAIVKRDLVSTRRFFLVTGFAPRPFREWFEQSLNGGFTDRRAFSSPWLEVTEFDRTSK